MHRRVNSLAREADLQSRVSKTRIRRNGEVELEDDLIVDKPEQTDTKNDNRPNFSKRPVPFSLW